MKKFFLSETTRPRALIFGMKHHFVDLYQSKQGCKVQESINQVPHLTQDTNGKVTNSQLVCSKLEPWGQKWPRPRDHMMYIGLYREKHKKNLLV